MIAGKVVAMILAGGQGSRLKQLTVKNAKPAVQFGGKYRIIDFALSNCANSGIVDVGILTQYQPLGLNAHIGIGVPWDLDRRVGGVEMLPPYMSTEGGRWYQGTANAIFENLEYIDALDPEFVLVLSGDHIYKMNYAKMVAQHRRTNSDLTISVIEVPWEETSRFGILNTDEEGVIYEFEEKPKQAKSNLASMGIYVFNWAVLREYLIEDDKNKDSEHDFGKNIVPSMLCDKKKLMAYKFEGYWMDVGTIDSYWQANMDLLNPENALNLFEDDWKIYTRNFDMPPHYLTEDAVVRNSLLNEGCVIEGTVKNSIISTEVRIGKGSVVEDSIILPNVVIGENCRIKKSIIMSNYRSKDNEVIESKDGSVKLIGTNDLGIVR